MSKQDRNGVRTAQDLERKYNVPGMQKAMKQTEQGIARVNKSMEEFAIEVLEKINNAQATLDGKVDIYFYPGVPTLETVPASEWKEEEYEIHADDLYYDETTGHAYRFTLIENTYRWGLIQDRDTVEALALANAAKDTADSKRRVFVVKPSPPYDSGDLWFNNQELYRCQISKAEGETYEEDDFIIATKYTDDTLAMQVGDNLEVVRGTVTTIKEGVDAFKIDIETQVKTIDELQQETIESMERMSYTFGTKALNIANSNDPVNASIDNQGLKVFNYRTLQSIFNHRGVGIQKLIVVGDTQLANISIVKAKDENGDDCTDFNFLVSNIQSLSDLEGGN